MEINRFKNIFALNIFRYKYAQSPSDSWDALAERLVEDVCGTRWGTDRSIMSKDDIRQLCDYIKQQKFIPGGRYLYYAGRSYKAFNNCYLLRAEEDTREEWSRLTYRAMSCLMTGGGIGIDYSILRPAGKPLSKTGGISSGPLPLMQMINEVGRGIMQGGSRRSAIYASLNWLHEDIPTFLNIKNWSDDLKYMKEKDFNFPCPLDMTNISINYDNKWKYNADRANLHTFVENCRQAMMTGEPGLALTLMRKKMKLFVTPVQKLQVKMILMYVILVLLIWVTLSHWKSLNLLWNWVLSFWYVELCVLIYLTRKCIKFEKRIDASDWVSWESTNGSSNVGMGMK